MAGAMLLVTSCESMMETDSTSVVVDKGQRLDSPNDSLYSAMGILSQLRTLGERYVALGELRGDLMTSTADADESLAQVSSLQMTADNKYAAVTEYYKVINNCNYALERMDTTVAIYQNKFLVPEYAAIKTMRDWTFWQLALAYGDVAWIEKPLLNVADATANYATIGMEQTAEKIISDLTPFVNTRALDYGTVDGYASRQFFYPVRLLLGDLCLYLNRYKEAAQYYYDYIFTNRLTVSDAYANNWRRDNRFAADMRHTESYMGEMLCGMMYSSDPREQHPSLIRWTYNESPAIVPSASFVNDMAHAMYFYSEEGGLSIGAYLEGDLRGQAVGVGDKITPSVMDTKVMGSKTMTRVSKYLLGATLNENGYDPLNTAVKGLYLQRMLPLVRIPHVYLRYAEALNRLGKPSVAFAVLKYGLTQETLNNPAKVSPWEVESAEPFINFSWIAEGNASSVIGTAQRGRGRGVKLDNSIYVIPSTCTSLNDSIVAVEDYIVDEMAAETAFEGNRFFDLLRVARHRNAFPEYMADKVCVKFSDKESARSRLLDAKTWFLTRK